MPPRKAASPQNGPKVVRRVVKKVLTEEVIEEIIEDSKPPAPRRTAAKTQKKLPTPNKLPVKSRISKPAPARNATKTEPSIAKETTSKKAAPKKAAPKKAAPKKAAPKKAVPKKAAPKKATPKKAAPKKATGISATQKTNPTLAKKPKPETKPKTPSSRVKKPATPAASSTPRNTPAAKKPPPKKPAAKVKKAAATEPKARKTKPAASKPRQSAAQPKNPKTPPAKPTIKKTRTPASTLSKKLAASRGTASLGDPQTNNQAMEYAQMLNGAMLTARQAAQEEMNALIQKNDHGPCAISGFDDPFPYRPDIPQLHTSSAGPNPFGQSAMQNPPPPMPRAKRVKQTARKSGGVRVTPAELEQLGLAGGRPIPPMPHARRFKQTARKSTGIPASRFKSEALPQPGASTLPSMPGTGDIKHNARNSTTPGRPSSSILASPSTRAPTTSNSQYVWELTHETGYVPDGFHSYMEPTKRNLGTFTTREAAVQKGRRLVGSDVGYSWEEVQESGDIEVVSDSSVLWEICWSPPDSEYSRVTARRIDTSAGRWVVDVEQGYPPSGFHSYQEPTKKHLGPYQSREAAVQIAKKQVGAVYGIDWDEVVEGGDLDVIENSSHKWEVSWTPPDSEHSHVVARMLPAGSNAETRNMSPDRESRDRQHDSDEDDSDEDGYGYYSIAF